MEIKTTTNENHYHLSEVDSTGNGRTISTYPEEHSDHMHLIENNIIKEFNNHSHLLIKEDEPKIEINDKYSIILNTGLGAKVSHITPVITGKLDSIIISSDKQINICIKMDGYQDVVIYEKAGFIGDKYLTVRNDVTYFNNEKAQNFAAKWNLKDKLIIEIDGGMDSNVKIEFRIDKNA